MNRFIVVLGAISFCCEIKLDLSWLLDRCSRFWDFLADGLGRLARVDEYLIDLSELYNSLILLV